MKQNFRSIAVLSSLLLIEVVAGCHKEPPAPVPNANQKSTDEGIVAPKSLPVTIKIETGNSEQDKQFTLAVQENDTVMNAMKAADAQGLRFKVTGEEAAAFITEINGLANNSPGNEGKNWLFYVNGKKANRSAAVFTVHAEDVILWKFEKFDPNRPNE